MATASSSVAHGGYSFDDRVGAFNGGLSFNIYQCMCSIALAVAVATCVVPPGAVNILDLVRECWA